MSVVVRSESVARGCYCYCLEDGCEWMCLLGCLMMLSVVLLFIWPYAAPAVSFALAKFRLHYVYVFDAQFDVNFNGGS